MADNWFKGVGYYATGEAGLPPAKQVGAVNLNAPNKLGYLPQQWSEYGESYYRAYLNATKEGLFTGDFNTFSSQINREVNLQTGQYFWTVPTNAYRYEEVETRPDVWVKTGVKQPQKLIFGNNTLPVLTPYNPSEWQLMGGAPYTGGAETAIEKGNKPAITSQYPWLTTPQAPTPDWGAIYKKFLPEMPSPAMTQYYGGQYTPMFQEYRAQALPAEPTATGWETFLKQYPFLEKYQAIPPYQRGERATAFAPPTKWLTY